MAPTDRIQAFVERATDALCGSGRYRDCQVMNADLSAPGATVMYEIPDVPDGTYHVVAFLDDNGNSTPESGPDMGDLVTAEGLGPGCVEVTVAGGESVVAPEAVNLNFLYPF